jgi:hypothetical protein
MSTTQEAPRKIRKDCRYNAEERKAIDLFKHTYQSQTTRDGRLVVLKSQILPAMFNHWVSVGRDPQDQAERETQARVCVGIFMRVKN